LKQAVRAPDSAGASNLLYTLWLHPKFSVEAIVKEHRGWAAAVADPLSAKASPHTNDRDPNRKLRIGYVSQDFWKHVLGGISSRSSRITIASASRFSVTPTGAARMM
jgi:hypothetical protein